MLNGDRVLTMAGHTPANPLTSEQQEAVDFAEAAIKRYTGGVWLDPGDPPTAEDLILRLSARRYYLPVPEDVVSVTAIVPELEDSSAQWDLRPGMVGAIVEDGGEIEAVRFKEGTYKLSVTRGREADERVLKAASLLASYYLGLSDPERSSYRNVASGDFSGDFRLELVPEAIVLLRPYRVGSVAGAA